MEVRIKDNQGYVDAEWTIEDGVMVVSPKKKIVEMKFGDKYFVPCVNPDAIGVNFEPVERELTLDLNEFWAFNDFGFTALTYDDCNEMCKALNKVIHECIDEFRKDKPFLQAPS